MLLLHAAQALAGMPYAGSLGMIRYDTIRQSLYKTIDFIIVLD